MMHQFTQPIVTIDGLGEGIVLPPCVHLGPPGSEDCAHAVMVGDEAEVIQRWGWPNRDGTTWVRDPKWRLASKAERAGADWRRVAFVRVVKVLPIVEWDEQDYDCVILGSSEPRRAYVYDPNDDSSTLIGHLPAAEPGGLVVVVERIDCPTCGGTSIDRSLYFGDDRPCPTCTTPPEVTT